MKNRIMHYLAYGSNMDHVQMKDRCPDSEFICPGRLTGYKFVYDGKSKTWGNMAVANIVKRKDGEVQGGIFTISKNDLKNLDNDEGYYLGIYDRDEFEIQCDDGKPYTCYVYLRAGREVGQPSEKYRDTVIKGANDCGLDDAYIKNNL